MAEQNLCLLEVNASLVRLYHMQHLCSNHTYFGIDKLKRSPYGEILFLKETYLAGDTVNMK